MTLSTDTVSAIIGPAGAVIALALMLAWVARLVQVQILPSLEKYIDRHLNQIDALLASHEKDRAVWVSGMQAISADLAAVRQDLHEGLSEVKADIEKIKPKAA